MKIINPNNVDVNVPSTTKIIKYLKDENPPETDWLLSRGGSELQDSWVNIDFTQKFPANSVLSFELPDGSIYKAQFENSILKNIKDWKEFYAIPVNTNIKNWYFMGYYDFKNKKWYKGNSISSTKKEQGIATYADVIEKIDYSQIKKAQLIFPSEQWEYNALELLRKFGVITGVYKSLNDAMKLINYWSTKRVKLNELVIGSHGAYGEVLITMDDTEHFFYDVSFLDKMKDIVQPDTKVFFTACHGAEFLDGLKDAAERLGAITYGSAGVYNYVLNKSEYGFYACSPQKFTLPHDRTIYPFEVNGEESTNIPGQIFNVYLRLSDLQKQGTPKSAPITIVIPEEVFNTKIEPLYGDIYLNDDEEVINLNPSNRDSDFIASYSVNISTIIQNNPTLKRLKINLSNTIINSLLKKGKIKLFVQTAYGNEIDLSSLEQYHMSNLITNEFLIQNGFCKRISGTPIQWL